MGDFYHEDFSSSLIALERLVINTGVVVVIFHTETWTMSHGKSNVDAYHSEDSFVFILVVCPLEYS